MIKFGTALRFRGYIEDWVDCQPAEFSSDGDIEVLG